MTSSLMKTRMLGQSPVAVEQLYQPIAKPRVPAVETERGCEEKEISGFSACRDRVLSPTRVFLST